MRTMIMWSGGVESTSLVKRYLEATDHEVFTHYVRMNSREGRMKYEDAAVAALLPRLQAIRPFHHDSSSLELIGGQGLAWDFQVLYPIGLVAMRHHRCTQIHRGLCQEDNWHRQEGLKPMRNPFGKNKEHRHGTLRRACLHMLPGDETLDSVAPFLPEYEWPKALHWANLGELAELTWSCRRPLPNGATCGRCHACTDRAAAKRGTSDIIEAREMLEATCSQN